MAIFITLCKEVNRDEKAPQNWMIEASVHFGPADAENHILNIRV